MVVNHNAISFFLLILDTSIQSLFIIVSEVSRTVKNLKPWLKKGYIQSWDFIAIIYIYICMRYNITVNIAKYVIKTTKISKNRLIENKTSLVQEH